MTGSRPGRPLVRALALAATCAFAVGAFALDEKWERLAKSREQSDRIDAVFALAKDGSEEALALFAKLLDDENVWVRDNAVVACSYLKKPEQIVRLLARAKSGNVAVRRNAADALGRTKCVDALPALRKLALEDRDAEVRRTALWALEAFEANPDAHAVAAAAAADPDPTIRTTAVYAAGRIKAPDAKKVVVAALADPDDRVRAVAISRLRWIDKQEVDASLAKFAADPSPRVRSTCAEVAWSQQTAPCMDVLISLLSDPDVRTAALAHRCLRRAARKNLDRDAQVWASWWGGARATWVPKKLDDPAYFWDDRYATKAQVYGASLAGARIAIVLDLSEPQATKLQGEETTRWDEIRGKIQDAVTNLDDDVAVNVIAADDEVRTAFREPRALDASARRQVKTFLDAQRPRGGCDLWGAMRTALDQPGVDTVLVVSYATRNAGEVRHNDRFFEGIQRRAEITRAVVHTVWLTSNAARNVATNSSDLLHWIADDTMGRPRMRAFE